MSPHTPGPWKVEQSQEYESTYTIVNGPGFLSHWVNPNAEEEEAANARLIAAAPDLLVACRMALNDRMYKDWPAIADALMAAIAKAEGR